MNHIRKQLTLFIDNSNETIEKIRAEFNSEQYHLISAHVTLCREDEITSLKKIIERIEAINLKKPLRIEFNGVERFSDGNGVLIPATDENVEFKELRKVVLGKIKLVKKQSPHITLMHPRNSICTDEVFSEIKEHVFPTELFFDKISLIEQRDGGRWRVIKEFNIVTKAIV